ncbi:MAG: UvrD-helicase domain-containing protein [Clostridiales bacterium]|nr:UvrD-helicase domain-containing protein [Candidatus Scatonaster coprocaballi]
MEDLLAKLNDEQKRAVLHDEGPLLILAGAGSGKTRVITYRIAYLIQNRGVFPSNILAITFTNKAANEMRERLEGLIGDVSRNMWVGTFHSMFARILRRHAEILGYTPTYTILDSDDQQKVIKEVIKEMELNDKLFAPRQVQGMISKAKNDMQSVESFEREAGGDFRMQKIAMIYRRYNDKLKANNAMDFDDILFYTVKLFQENPDILTMYQDKFKYILVDEYQDTNHCQYLMIQLLAKRYRNLCVVGDDDQSIYSFRGADLRNILDFEKDFRDTEIIKLEENYRSTETILKAANAVIAHNKKRKDKALRTNGEKGEKITFLWADHHGIESYYCAERIKREAESGAVPYREVAILYRMNSLSRTIESALREKGVPYRVYGGMRFYDRKEIKDVLAYLRLIYADEDNYAFERIINVPKRGIGDATVERILAIAESEHTTALDVCRKAVQHPELSRAASKLYDFAVLIEEMRRVMRENQASFSEFIEYVQDKSGMVNEIVEQQEKKGEMVDRVENLKELLSEAVEFETRRKAEIEQSMNLPEAVDPKEAELLADEPNFGSDLTGILGAYLQNAALYSEGDNQDDSEEYVRLMTIHSAKGLEFTSVYLVGVDETIFPSARSVDSDEVEEERRLMYVAITRAKRKLTIISARSRMLFGKTTNLQPSRFLKEIPREYLNPIANKRQEAPKETMNPRYAREGGYRDSSGYDRSGSVVSYGGSASQGAPAEKPYIPVFQKKQPAASTSDFTPDSISKGMRVTHPRFGDGIVVSCEKVAGDALVCVDFDGMKKNMLLNKSGLKRS